MPTNSNPYDRNRSDRQQPGAITAPDCFGLDRLVRVLGLTVVTVEIRRIENIAPGLQAREDRADMFRPIRS